jgi:hypothetical protein
VLCVPARGVERGVDGAVRPHERERFEELPVVERTSESLPEAAGCVESPQHRQGVDAFDEIVACGLAELRLGGDDVEHVVHDLECDPVGLAVLREGVHVAAGQATDEGADSARRREQGGRLALDGMQVCGLRARDVVGRPELSDLSLAQPPDRGREQRSDLGAEGSSDLRGLGQQEVAGQDGGEVPPPCVHALDRSPGHCLVDDVVVVERPEVDELDRDAAAHCIVADLRFCGSSDRGRDREQRTDALAAGRHEMAGDLGQERVSHLY